MNDEQLVEYFQATADKQYFGIIYERYYEKVYRCCFGILKECGQANDITQDIMLIVLDKLPQVRNGKLLSFWIYRIAKNEAVKAAKNSARLRADDIATTLDYAAEPDGAAKLLHHELRLACVRRLIRDLKPLDRMIVELKYFKKASIRDLQQETGLSASAVKMRLMRARGQMLQLFHQNELRVG